MSGKITWNDARLAEQKTDVRMAHVHIQLPIGAKFTGFCPQNDKSTLFLTYNFII